MSVNPEYKAGKISELPEAECRVLLSTTTVGRIAFVDDEGQQLVPVNFAFILVGNPLLAPKPPMLAL